MGQRYAEIAEPTKIEQCYGGPLDGQYRVTADCPGCGNEVKHLMHYDEFGPSHRVCEALCGGGYELARPWDGLIMPFKWWKDDSRLLPVDNLGLGFRGDSQAPATGGLMSLEGAA